MHDIDLFSRILDARENSGLISCACKCAPVYLFPLVTDACERAGLVFVPTRPGRPRMYWPHIMCVHY